MAALLAGVPSLALAVDPLLHDLPEPEPPPAVSSPPAPVAASEEDLADVEVSEIRDLGPKPPTAEPPGDLWQRIRSGFAIADLDGALVVQQQKFYAQRQDQIQRIVDRSRRYLFHIVAELERRGLPTELALLPMVESAYNPMAYSRAHASGLWQFIPSTGRNYNLGQNWWFDARRDVVASTSAALDYLQSLHDMFGDWHLALAAYNMGENGVQRAIDRNRAKKRGTDYASLPMPRETRRYVPTLQALKNIVANPAAFGVELDPIPDAPYFVSVTLTRDIDLDLAAKLAEMPVEELVALNPGHNRPVVAAALAPQLVLPNDRAEAFLQNLERHEAPLSSWDTYTFKAGDKLAKLAAEHGVSVDRLKAINGLGPKGVVVIGQQLLLPQKGTAAASEPLPPIFSSPARFAAYLVRQGDTWAKIAAAFGVRVDDLKRLNDGAELLAGESLVIQLTPKRTVRKPVKRRPAGTSRPSAASSSPRLAAPAAARPSH
ncbi:MAG TPA: transglycosylase SLT domain-containing protein [Burkholderiales bacterium]|nr:transglycosylase SLT domain-containing protein [Burkholderiales bacterium]